MGVDLRLFSNDCDESDSMEVDCANTLLLTAMEGGAAVLALTRTANAKALVSGRVRSFLGFHFHLQLPLHQVMAHGTKVGEFAVRGAQTGGKAHDAG